MSLFVNTFEGLIDASMAASKALAPYNSFGDLQSAIDGGKLVSIVPAVTGAMGVAGALGTFVWNEGLAAGEAGYTLAPITSITEGVGGALSALATGLTTSIPLSGATVAAMAALGVSAGGLTFELHPKFWTEVYNKTFGKALGELNPDEIAELANGTFYPAILLEGLTYLGEDFIDIVKTALFNDGAFASAPPAGTLPTDLSLTNYYSEPTLVGGQYQYTGSVSVINKASGTTAMEYTPNSCSEKAALVLALSTAGYFSFIGVSKSNQSFIGSITSYTDRSGRPYANPIVQTGSIGRTPYTADKVDIGNSGLQKVIYSSSIPLFDTDEHARAYINSGSLVGLLNGKTSSSNYDIMDGATVPKNINDSITDTFPSWAEKAKVLPVPATDALTTTKAFPLTIPSTKVGVEPNALTQPLAQAGTKPLPDTIPAKAITDGIVPTVTAVEKAVPKAVPKNPPTGDAGSTPIVVPPTGTASALWTVYNPNKTTLDQLGSWLWSSNFVDQLKKMFNNPADAIIGLHKIFISPTTGGSQNIKVGYLDSGVGSTVVTNQYCKVSCGSVSLPEFFNNCQDYGRFTAVQLYLPFVGFVKLNVNDVMNGTLAVDYTCDVLTGSFIVTVTVTRNASSAILYQYGGNMAVQYPLSSGSFASVITSLISTGAGIAGAVATGGALAPIALGGAMSLANSRASVSVSGGFTSQTGAMASKVPYLVVTRPVVANAFNYNSFYGYPTNLTTTLSSCSGFTKVKSILTKISKATDTEKEEIKSLLESGVIV